MNISLLGSGNAATVLGRLIASKQHVIDQVFSNTIDNARRLAEELDCPAVNKPEDISLKSDLYIIAVSDDAIKKLSAKLRPVNAVVVHTAGSVPMSAISDLSSNHGVFYPLQSMRRELPGFPDIPFLIQGNSASTRSFLQNFASSLEVRYKLTTDEERRKYHLAAVLANNFSNHLFAITEEFCTKENVEFNMLLPLIRETAVRLESLSPASLQTGPAVRNDEKTIEAHEALLSAYPKLLNLYRLMTESIREQRS